MKQSDFLRTKELFHGSNTVRRYTFKTITTRYNCAILAKANHQLAMRFAILRHKSARFLQDCFKCPSPHKTAA